MKQKIGVENIDHVGIVVPNIEQAIRHYEKNFHVERSEIKVSKKQKVKISLLTFKNIKLELIEPLDQQSPINGFLSKINSLFKNEKFDSSSIIVTWWDFGYWLNYFSGLSSVHDGGSQRSPKTYLVANSLTSTSQKSSYNNIKYLVSSLSLIHI